jgi:hypothetical protein
MEEQFRRLPYQLYAPVREQLFRVAREVNRRRRRSGFAPIDYGCISNKLRLAQVFASSGDERLRDVSQRTNTCG